MQKKKKKIRKQRKIENSENEAKKNLSLFETGLDFINSDESIGEEGIFGKDKNSELTDQDREEKTLKYLLKNIKNGEEFKKYLIKIIQDYLKITNLKDKKKMVIDSSSMKNYMENITNLIDYLKKITALNKENEVKNIIQKIISNLDQCKKQ